MQQPKKHYHNGNNAENQTHTPPICREVPRKYYMKADTQSSNDEAFPEHRNDDKNSAVNIIMFTRFFFFFNYYKVLFFRISWPGIKTHAVLGLCVFPIKWK